MQERTDSDRQFSATNRDPDHAITVNVVATPVGRPLQASCLCGWVSPIEPSRPRASAHGDVHLSRIARERAAAIRHSIEGRDNAAAKKTPSSPPCPPWCVMKHHGEWELMRSSAGTLLQGDKWCRSSRSHVRGVSGSVHVHAERWAGFEPGHRVEVGAVRIRVDGEEMTVGQAAKLADALTATVTAVRGAA